MKIGFSLWGVEITLLDTNTDSSDDWSLCSDKDIADLVNPSLETNTWTPESQSAFEEACHRNLIDYNARPHRIRGNGEKYH